MHFVASSSEFVVSSQLVLDSHGEAQLRYVSKLQKRISKDGVFVLLFLPSLFQWTPSVCLVTKIHKCLISDITAVIRTTIQNTFRRIIFEKRKGSGIVHCPGRSCTAPLFVQCGVELLLREQ